MKALIKVGYGCNAPCTFCPPLDVRHVDAPADRAGVRDGSVRSYGLASPDGQLLVLDRDSDRVVLSNQAGSRLELTEAGVLLHAEADLTIEAPGRRGSAHRLMADDADGAAALVEEVSADGLHTLVHAAGPIVPQRHLLSLIHISEPTRPY